MLGGKCRKCGYVEHPAALQFHHRKPEEKLYEITKVMASASNLIFENFIIPEIRDKCDLLCSNCHDIHHHGGGWPEDMLMDKTTGFIAEAIEETKFQERLKKLSELPLWKKQELWDQMKMNELMFSDIKRIFGEDD